MLLGLLQLAEKHPVAALEKAAQTATHHGAWRLRDLKRLLELPANVQLDFLESHPLIRSLEPGEEWSWCFVDELALLVPAVSGETRIPPSPLGG